MKNLTLGILVKRFPKLSETFIHGEIVSLLEQGWQIYILSLYRPNEALVQPKAHELVSKVTYLDPLDQPVNLKQLVKFVFNTPIAGLRLLRDLVAGRVRIDQLMVLIAAIQRLGIDHIHAHYFSEPAILAEHATSLTGKTFSVSGHAKDIYLTPPEAVSARLLRAQFVTTCTGHNSQYLKAVNPAHRHKVNLIYHGIDSQYFHPPSCREKQDDKALVVAIGRFKKKKGFDILIRACAKLLCEGVSLHCKIVGYGDQQDVLQALIDELRVSKYVALCPPVNHSAVKEILQRASVYVIPCRITSDGDRDGIPNSLLEAMACGVPSITTPISGIPEVVQSGTNGLLVEPENVDELSRAILDILSNRELRTKLSRCGRETVMKRFNWKSNVTRLADLLHSVAQDNAKAQVIR